MGDMTDNSPGQLRRFEQEQSWMPPDDKVVLYDSNGTATESAASPNAAGTAGTDNAGATTETTTPNNSWQAVGQNAALNNGGYFSHDGKLYQQKDGKTFLVTGDAMGDVELDADQAAQVNSAREAQRQTEAARKEELRNAQWTTEGYSPNPDAPPESPGYEITFDKLTPQEKAWVSANIAGPFVATIGFGKGLKEGFPSPWKMAGNGILQGAMGYTSGKTAGQYYLDTFDPSVPRIRSK